MLRSGLFHRLSKIVIPIAYRAIKMEQESGLYKEVFSTMQQTSFLESKPLVIKRKDYSKIGIELMGVDLKANFSSSYKLPETYLLPKDTESISEYAYEKTNSSADIDYASFKIISDLNTDFNQLRYEKETKKFDHDKDVVYKHNFGSSGVNDLPSGWEKHEDNHGCYYWHIKSGTIQRELPTWQKCNYKNSNISLSINSLCSSVTISRTTSAIDQQNKRNQDNIHKYNTLKSDSDESIRFAVRSLGWVEMVEADLTPDKSSKAVNKCIVDLSLGRNDVGRWGDGKHLFMDLDRGSLKLIDPEKLGLVNSQPIHTIRVWGVGRDNGRDFAYVARDRLTRVHMCHVFRCDTAARVISNTLRDICKRIMIERSMQLDASSICFTNANIGVLGRPTDLLTDRTNLSGQSQFFPTPMEETKKLLKAQYLGYQEVSQPTGMDILNSAIDYVVANTKPEHWKNVNIAVAPSSITVYSSADNKKIIVECRVRYLSFLGIGKNFKKFAFIMYTAQEKFIAHIFHCEPSSGPLCKTLEAACKLRYQKCLDAHPENRLIFDSTISSKGVGATLRNLMHSISLQKERLTL